MEKGDSTGILDRSGNMICVGDFLYYTERPISDYADSLLESYFCERTHRVKIRPLVFNNQGSYSECDFDCDGDMLLSVYSGDSFGHCKGVTDDCIIVRPDGNYVNWMKKNFPLVRNQKPGAD